MSDLCFLLLFNFPSQCHLIVRSSARRGNHDTCCRIQTKAKLHLDLVWLVSQPTERCDYLLCCRPYLTQRLLKGLLGFFSNFPRATRGTRRASCFWLIHLDDNGATVFH